MNTVEASNQSYRQETVFIHFPPEKKIPLQILHAEVILTVCMHVYLDKYCFIKLVWTVYATYVRFTCYLATVKHTIVYVTDTTSM